MTQQPAPATFIDLTFDENTALYMKIRSGSEKLSKASKMLIDLGAYEASSVVNEINGELIRLLEDLNDDSPIRRGLAEHTEAACDTITRAALPGRMGTGQVADDDEESLIFADESEYAE